MKNVCRGVTYLLTFILLFSFTSQAQDKSISGRVVDDQNEPIPGASVSVKNTSLATATNADGQFTLSVPATAQTLVISSVGFTTQEVTISNEPMVITMARTTGGLDEVVVVGYGTQKKSVVTGSISSVKSKDLENIPNGRIEQALQGRVSGVTILQNSGQPGSTSTIRIRGITTFNGGGNDPLWVVDGVAVDAGGIGYLNQSDIESIEVLKDAASAAIYGTRAAAGVILVTTKKGKSGKLSINYNGFYGVSSPAKVVDLANATQYAILENERLVAGGEEPKFTDVASLGKGTDWQKAIFNNSAHRYLNEISISGGNERSTFYMSFGMQNQEGIVATPISNYTKKNFRINSTHKISKIFTFGQTLGFTHQNSIGLGNTNSEFGGPLSSAINLDPITPIVVTDPQIANALPYSDNPVLRDENGNPYGISSLVGQEMTNPLAYIKTRYGQNNWSDDIVGNAYLEAKISDFKFRSTLGVKRAYWGNVGFTPVYYLSSTVSNLKNNYGKGENRSFNWNIENTITYNKKISDHEVTILLGQGTYVENNGGYTGITLFNLPISNFNEASFNFDIPTADKTTGASDFTPHKIYSLFARANYSYQDKYLFTGIIRRDASTRFGPGKKYGIFPSFSAGWNVDRENFWSNAGIFNSLKIRGGYGVVGNDALPDFRYLATIVGGFNYPIGTEGNVTTGYSSSTLDNPNLHWEQTASADIGFETRFLNNFNLTFDVFNKKTSGILQPIVIPGYVGVPDLPYDNVADMVNKGFEVELGYQRQIGELGFSLNGNFSYLKNEVTYVSADTNFLVGIASFQSMGAVTRTKVGQSFNEFWGYKTMGIFQNDAEVAAYVGKNGELIQPNARPGDFRWLDANGDGKITEADKVYLGNNIPKYTFGFTINLNYKGFDFLAFGQGAAGNKIFQGLRRLDIATANYPAKYLGRWTGEGTSNDIPRLVKGDPNGNISQMSDFYLEKGDYLRLKVVQLGYTLPGKWMSKAGISRLRVYVTAENLATLTNYTGYDPEVGGGVFGIDKGQYPQARGFMGGIQIQF